MAIHTTRMFTSPVLLNLLGRLAFILNPPTQAADIVILPLVHRWVSAIGLRSLIPSDLRKNIFILELVVAGTVTRINIFKLAHHLPGTAQKQVTPTPS